MPIVTEEAAPEARRTSGKRWLWLLTVAPLLLVTLILAASRQPLQLGPFVFTTDGSYAPGAGWNYKYILGPGPPEVTGIVIIPRQQYGLTEEFVLRGRGSWLMLGLGDWSATVTWFPGQRKR